MAFTNTDRNTEDHSGLTLIYTLSALHVKLYMSMLGHLYWSYENSNPEPFEKMPNKIQLPFLIKLIQNHELSERLKFIHEPLVFIEMYVKTKFFMNADLELGEQLPLAHSIEH